MQWVFEDCVLDLDRRELRRASQVVATAPQVFDLLIYLAENRGRVVSRDDLVNAVWAGKIVSESTLASHINAVRKAVGDSGQQQRVIRTIARKGFRFVAGVANACTEATAPADAPARTRVPSPDSSADIGLVDAESALPVPAGAGASTRPSIAVLPFVNLSGDPGQDYLADGVVEDIIAALSQYRWLFVVARNSSFTYKARAVDVKQVGREMGVRYVLEGSWRKAENRVRITGQLIDAATGTHHWAGRFEGVLRDIFELQDQITESVVGAIAPELERVEIERARHKPTESLDAYDYYLRGTAELHDGTRQTIDRALALFYKSIECDPDYASAYAMAAWCHHWRKLNGWMVDRAAESQEGARLARRAIELGKGDAIVLARSGHVLSYLAGDAETGLALLDRALVLNPNLASAWFLGGFLKLWIGQAERAIEQLTHAMRLSPLDPELYRMCTGMAAANFVLERFDEATFWAEKALQDLPTFLMPTVVLTASHALAGRTADARRSMASLRQLDPSLRISNLADWLPTHRPEPLALMVEGLRKAGLPD